MVAVGDLTEQERPSAGPNYCVDGIVGNIQTAVQLIGLIRNLLRPPLVACDEAGRHSDKRHNPFEIFDIETCRRGPEPRLIRRNMFEKRSQQSVLRIFAWRQIKFMLGVSVLAILIGSAGRLAGGLCLRLCRSRSRRLTNRRLSPEHIRDSRAQDAKQYSIAYARKPFPQSHP